MSGIWSILWWKMTAENVLLTFLSTLVSLWTASGFNLFSMGSIAWGAMLGAAGSAAVLALVYSVIATLKSGTVGPPSLVRNLGPKVKEENGQ